MSRRISGQSSDSRAGACAGSSSYPPGWTVPLDLPESLVPFEAGRGRTQARAGAESSSCFQDRTAPLDVPESLVPVEAGRGRTQARAGAGSSACFQDRTAPLDVPYSLGLDEEERDGSVQPGRRRPSWSSVQTRIALLLAAVTGIALFGLAALRSVKRQRADADLGARGGFRADVVRVFDSAGTGVSAARDSVFEAGSDRLRPGLSVKAAVGPAVAGSFEGGRRVLNGLRARGSSVAKVGEH
jgi:hypothetical protein